MSDSHSLNTYTNMYRAFMMDRLKELDQRLNDNAAAELTSVDKKLLDDAKTLHWVVYNVGQISLREGLLMLLSDGTFGCRYECSMSCETTIPVTWDDFCAVLNSIGKKVKSFGYNKKV